MLVDFSPLWVLSAGRSTVTIFIHLVLLAILFGSGKIPQAFADLPVRGFYMPSYGVNDLVDETNDAQLESFRAQIPSASHAVLAVHVRVPGGIRSNTVVRNQVSEKPSHLVPWFNLAKTKGLRTGMIIILFSDNSWGWGGNWKPSNPGTALASYYSAIRPYVQAAQAAKVEFVILCDEWSELYYSYANTVIVPAFRQLVKKARADYTGEIGINVNKLEETSVKTGIVALVDFVGITAYVPLANIDRPSYRDMVNNLIGPSQVESVRAQVTEKSIEWGRPDVRGYMTYLRYLASQWNKPILLTTGYKSTLGAARDPADQPETTVDRAIQASAWGAFIDAALDTRYGVGKALYGILGWRLWPKSSNDDGATGFSVQNKPAAGLIAERW